MVAVSHTLVQQNTNEPIRMTDECGKFRTAISLWAGHVHVTLLDHPGEIDWKGNSTFESYLYYADDAVIARLQNELSAMVKAGKARRSRAIWDRTYYV